MTFIIWFCMGSGLFLIVGGEIGLSVLIVVEVFLHSRVHHPLLYDLMVKNRLVMSVKCNSNKNNKNNNNNNGLVEGMTTFKKIRNMHSCRYNETVHHLPLTTVCSFFFNIFVRVCIHVCVGCALRCLAVSHFSISLLEYLGL
jgi:hypothetical protein